MALAHRVSGNPAGRRLFRHSGPGSRWRLRPHNRRKHLGPFGLTALPDIIPVRHKECSKNATFQPVILLNILLETTERTFCGRARGARYRAGPDRGPITAMLHPFTEGAHSSVKNLPSARGSLSPRRGSAS